MSSQQDKDPWLDDEERDIAHLYQQGRTASPVNLDKRILEMAKEKAALYAHNTPAEAVSHRFLETLYAVFVTPKMIPAWVISGIFTGILLAPVFYAQLPRPGIGYDVSPDTVRGEQNVLSEVDNLLQTLETKAPEEWLYTISDLLLAGKTSEAHQLLYVFIQRYPDYGKE